MDEVKAQGSRYPFEYWVMLALVLGQSGWDILVFAAFIWYLVLKWRRPGSDFELLMVASGYLGTVVVWADLVFMWGRSPFRMIEPILLSGFAVALFYTRRRGLAWFLLVVSSLGAVASFLGAILPMRQRSNPQSSVISALIDLLWVWLLIHWLRRTRGAPNHQRIEMTGARPRWDVVQKR